jgi:hypothetical protein
VSLLNASSVTHALIRPSAASATVSGSGPAIVSATGAPINATAIVNVTVGFTTAIDAILANCSLAVADKTTLRSSALQQLLGYSNIALDMHAAYAATIIGAVVDAIAAHNITLPTLTATVDPVQTFAASLDAKINACSLSADDKVKLTGAALAAVFEAGSVNAQVAICAAVLAKVDAAISANVAILGDVKATASAGMLHA